MTRMFRFVVAIISALILLAACGGGGDGEDPPANQSPRADAGADQTVDAGDTVTLDGSGSSDPDGTIASYQWMQPTGPAVSLSTADQASTSFVAPALSVATELVFRLTVTDDDGETASDEVSVMVSPSAPANEPPSADAGADQTVDAGDTVTLDGSGSSDPDGAIASYQWTQPTGPAASLSTADQASASFVAPALSAAAELVFRLTVTDDDGATASDDVSVTIQPEPANQLPSANAGVDQTVDAGDTVTLDGSGSSDPDGAIASHQWTQPTGPAVSLSTADQASASFVAPALSVATELVFRLTVTDDDGEMASDDVSVTVQPEIDVTQYLTGPVERGESPGLIAAVIDAQGVVRGVGAAGVRRQGSPEQLTVNDLFHIASDGKAMTATMLAALIDEDIFPNDWDTTIADVFPELMDVIDPAYHDVTLFQLLRMTGGVVGEADADWDAIGTDYQGEPDIMASRYALVRDTLQLPPAGPEPWVYSSLGYVVAAAMAEKLTGESWEALMETHLLDPLGMTTAGFGFDWPDTPSAAEWGHFLEEGAWTPVELSMHLAHAELIGPAGGVHLSVEDWARFIALWFPGQTPAILDRTALDELLVTALGFYAPGWFVNEGESGFSFAEGGWTGGPGIYHYGGGGIAGFSAYVRILPDNGIAYVVFANASSAFSPDGSQNEVFASLDTIVANLHDDPDVQDIADEFQAGR